MARDQVRMQTEEQQPPSNEAELQKIIEKDLEQAMRSMRVLPRWTFLIVILVIVVILSVLSERLTFGPSWVLPALVVLLVIPLIVTGLRGYHPMTRPIALGVIGLVTIALFTSVILLVIGLFQHAGTGTELFRDALLLWIANVVTFGLWYWEVDQGGPIRRRSHHAEPPDFVFPQTTVNLDAWAGWQPGFLDYLFLAFNTSTAFSPTDTMAMSWRVKLLMMLQSAISLMILAVLAARAVNIA